MKKNKPINKFDSLVDRLVQEFVKIPNFDLTMTDEIGNKTFNIITFRLAEVMSYKGIPSTKYVFQT